MKFVPVSDYAYWWPINIDRPSTDRSGQWVRENFDMRFKAVDQDTAEALAAEIREIKDDQERVAREHDQLLNACVDWRGVVDDDKKEIPFSRDMLVTMLKAAPWYRLGIYKSWTNSLMRDEARKGN